MNIFDNIAERAFGIASSVMGYEASWTPSFGDVVFNAKVLFRGPTSRELSFGRDWEEEQCQIEYHEVDFPGLYDSINSSAEPYEVVVVDGNKYAIIEAKKKFDGRTIVLRGKQIQ